MSTGEVEHVASPATLRVSELHAAVAAALAGVGLAQVWVAGVVSGLRVGRRYSSWELVEYEADATTVRAVIAVGAFRREMEALQATLASAGAELVDGVEVALWGRLDSNPAFGRLRLLAEGIDARTTVGAAVLARQRLVAELEESGELGAQRRLVLPALIRRVGLVSAVGGAGRSDVLAVLERSPLTIEVVEAQAPMSGPGAPGGVAAALACLAGAGVEVVVVARGGGARSDMAAWDSPAMARAIARCPVPVLSAVGHAPDRTVADLVAHEAHPTPSAAAAALVARAETAQRDAHAEAAAGRHRAELSRAQCRARLAALVAVVALLVAVVVVLFLT